MTEWALYLRKGLIAVAGGLGQLALALTPISHGGEAVTGAEWVQVALAALAAIGVVAFGNGPRPEASDRLTSDERDGRHEA